MFACQARAKMEQHVYPEDQLIRVNVQLDGWEKTAIKYQVRQNFQFVNLL